MYYIFNINLLSPCKWLFLIPFHMLNVAENQCCWNNNCVEILASVVGIQSSSYDSVMKTGFMRTGIAYLMSVHDVDTSSAFFCFDKAWTHPSRVQQARFSQLELSHTWQHGAVATLPACTCPCPGAEEQTLGHCQVTHCSHMHESSSSWRGSACVSVHRQGFH